MCALRPQLLPCCLPRNGLSAPLAAEENFGLRRIIPKTGVRPYPWRGQQQGKLQNQAHTFIGRSDSSTTTSPVSGRLVEMVAPWSLPVTRKGRNRRCLPPPYRFGANSSVSGVISNGTSADADSAGISPGTSTVKKITECESAGTRLVREVARRRIQGGASKLLSCLRDEGDW